MKKLRIVWVLLLCLVTSLAVFAACDNTKSPQGGKDDLPPQVEDVFAGVTFSDEAFTYDGTVKVLEVKNLPEGVSAVYENNSKTDAGSYTVSVKLTKGEEEKTLSATLTINKAPLVITAENKTVKYGTDLPEFTVTYSGFVNEETVSVLGGELAFEEMSASLPVGTYKITPKGLTANNYEIEYRKGNLTVTPQDLTGATIANTVTQFTSELTEIDLSASLSPADNVEKGVSWSLKSGGDSDWFTLEGNKLLCPVKKSIPLDTVFPKKITVVLTTNGVNSDGDNITDEKEFTVNYRDEKYEITNEDELINALCVNVNKKYILKNDIILNKYKNGLNGITGPNGAKWRTTVSGVFDGDGYTISGLTGTSTNYYGFFHQINEGATVENLRLSGSIETNAAYGAGFVNELSGKVRNCINEINIKTIGKAAGFVVQLKSTGSIENCIQLGKVEHGTTQANIDNTGSFTGGGDGSAYTNCFFVTSKTGISTFGPGKWYAETGLTYEEYYTAVTYAGFDVSIWNISDFSAPTLKNANNSGTTEKPIVEITNAENSVKAGDTLQVSANNPGGGRLYTDFSLGYKLETPVDGVSVDYKGIISVDKSVAAGTKFTVVAYALIDANVKASKEFAVTANSVTLESDAVNATYDLSKTAFEFECAVNGTLKTYGGENITSNYASGKYTVQKSDMPAMPTGGAVTLVIESGGKFYPVNVFTVTAVITTGAQLQAINDDLNGYYVLGGNIDLSQTVKYDTAIVFHSIGRAPIEASASATGMVESRNYNNIGVTERAFNGTFDGKGFSITGLTVSKRISNKQLSFANFGVGLFGLIGENGIVKNFALSVTKIVAANDVGLVAGYNLGTVENVIVNAAQVQYDWANTGVVGFNRGNLRNVICLADGNISGVEKSGLSYFVVNNGNTASASARKYGVIENCYSAALVQSTFTRANVVGEISNSGYKTEAELKTASLYENFDKTVWNIVDGAFPTLKPQN